MFFFARDAGVSSFSREPHPLAMLAEVLEEKGHAWIAARAYALAYTATRGDWLEPFGGKKSYWLIERATMLCAPAAQDIYADQLLLTLRSSTSGLDLSADVLHRLYEWSLPELEAVWHEVLGVIQDRTPELGLPSRLPRFDRDLPENDWALDEVLVAVLLGRLSDPRSHYKVEALRGVIDALKRRPDDAARPLAWWLKLELPRTSLVLVLECMIELEDIQPSLIHAIRGELEDLARSRSWLVRSRASSLLQHIDVVVVLQKSALGDAPEQGPMSPLAKASRSGELGSWRALDDVRLEFKELLETAICVAHASLPDEYERGNRAKLMLGRDFDGWPEAPVVLWETEKLFEALDDGLARIVGGASESANHESPNPDVLEAAMVPDVGFHVGRSASRVVRPNWETPTEFEDYGAVDTLSVVDGGDDPAYAGWTRLGFTECECPVPSNSGYGARPEQQVTIWVAVCAWPQDTDMPDDAFPFLPCGEFAQSHGPIVGAQRERSWLGEPCRLEPPLSLVREQALTRSGLGEPLIWFDSHGKAAVAVRTWRILRDDPDAEPTTNEGCDLLVRPDMLRALRALYGDLRELRVNMLSRSNCDSTRTTHSLLLSSRKRRAIPCDRYDFLLSPAYVHSRPYRESLSRPALVKRQTSSTRELTPSLRKIVIVWPRIVETLLSVTAAIALLVSPRHFRW